MVSPKPAPMRRGRTGPCGPEDCAIVPPGGRPVTPPAFACSDGWERLLLGRCRAGGLGFPWRFGRLLHRIARRNGSGTRCRPRAARGGKEPVRARSRASTGASIGGIFGNSFKKARRVRGPVCGKIEGWRPNPSRREIDVTCGRIGVYATESIATGSERRFFHGANEGPFVDQCRTELRRRVVWGRSLTCPTTVRNAGQPLRRFVATSILPRAPASRCHLTIPIRQVRRCSPPAPHRPMRT